MSRILGLMVCFLKHFNHFWPLKHTHAFTESLRNSKIWSPAGEWCWVWPYFHIGVLVGKQSRWWRLMVRKVCAGKMAIICSMTWTRDLRAKVQVSSTFWKFALRHFTFTKDPRHYLFLLTERHPKRILPFYEKRWKAKIAFRVCCAVTR